MTFIKDKPNYEFISCWFCMRNEVAHILERFKKAGAELKKEHRGGYGNSPDYVVPLGKEHVVSEIISQLDQETIAETHRLLNRKHGWYS